MHAEKANLERLRQLPEQEGLHQTRTSGGNIVDCLPFEIDRQGHGDLVAREDVLRGHFCLALAHGENAAHGDVWIRNTVLAGTNELKIVAALEDHAIVGWDVEATYRQR